MKVQIFGPRAVTSFGFFLLRGFVEKTIDLRYEFIHAKAHFGVLREIAEYEFGIYDLECQYKYKIAFDALQEKRNRTQEKYLVTVGEVRPDLFDVPFAFKDESFGDTMATDKPKALAR